MNLNKLPVIGLTGGIGSGKSTAAEYLVSRGFAHIDADEIGRNMTGDGEPLLSRLLEIFGEDIFENTDPDTLVLNRRKTADIVFNDKEKLRVFNDLMFTEIIDVIKRNIEEINLCHDKGCRGILIDAPLLFEAGVDGLCDSIVLVTADTDTRIKRVCRRDGITEKEVRNRINNQMSEDDKISRSEYVADNSGDLSELKKCLDEIIEKL
ncbi:MAG: dephospho-CoA kinase [Firmicutes bacterium]|nr:dephospho-CoA kinase [Bacillota bacterium]